MKVAHFTRLFVVIALGVAFAPSFVEGCSRVLWNDTAQGVFVARTMDWPESTEPILMVFPRGIERNGGLLAGENIIPENAAQWTSKYGSMVTSIYGIGAVDGFNEKGLAFHMLYLNATDFGQRDASKPGVHAGLWGAIFGDNATNVQEALSLMEQIQVVMANARGHKAFVHVALEDASGDSAIIEFINGKPVVHHGRQFKIMTNDPTYDEQLELLKQHDFSNATSDTPLPGNVASRPIPTRGLLLGPLPAPKNEREAVASMLAIVRNVSVPFGAPYKGFGIYNTEYRTVINVSKLRYFFELTTSPNVIWADLTKFKLDAGAPVMAIDPDNIDLSGDVTEKFKALDKAPF